MTLPFCGLPDSSPFWAGLVLPRSFPEPNSNNVILLAHTLIAFLMVGRGRHAPENPHSASAKKFVRAEAARRIHPWNHRALEAVKVRRANRIPQEPATLRRKEQTEKPRRTCPANHGKTMNTEKIKTTDLTENKKARHTPARKPFIRKLQTFFYIALGLAGLWAVPPGAWRVLGNLTENSGAATQANSVAQAKPEAAPAKQEPDSKKAKKETKPAKESATAKDPKKESKPKASREARTVKDAKTSAPAQE